MSVAIRGEATSTVGILLGTAFAVLAVAVAIPDEKWAAWLGTNGVAVINYLQVVLGVAFLMLLVVAAVRVGIRLQPSSDPVPESPPSLFKCRVLDTEEDARLINKELVARVFPDGSIDPEHALKAQQKNPRRLVGLIDARTDRIAGWSSIWPVTVSAGRAIECGRRIDDDLKVEDVLPANRNKQAKYLVLLSFAILPEYRNAPENPVRRFGRFVLDHIVEEFLGTPGRKVKLVAIAYTAGGKRLCRDLLKLEQNGCYADYGAKGKKPIFVGEVDATSLIKRVQDA